MSQLPDKSSKKIVFTHTDFRLYWLPRLNTLKNHIDKIGWRLKVIEIAGKGSPYYFAPDSKPSNDWWSVLFPFEKMEDIRPAIASKKLFDALQKEKPDIVFAGAIAYPSGATAVRWARENNRHVVIFDDARQCDVLRNIFVNAVKRRIYAKVDAAFIPAQTHSKDYIKFGFNSRQLFFGVDVVDNNYFSSHANKARKLPENHSDKYDLPERFILGVGRQIPIKNWPGLLDAWKKFCQIKPQSDLSLLLVGHGPDRALLEQTVKTKKIKRVFFHDFTELEALATRYYPSAEAFILPSFNETWGLVVNEAMASGLPVLVSKSCGCSETLVRHGTNGWCFDPFNSDNIAQCIVELDSLDRNRLQMMGNASTEIIRAWNLDRFVLGVIEATNFSLNSSIPSLSLIDRLLLKAWKGRYRPI